MSGIRETARNSNISLPRSEWKKVFISYQLSVISYQFHAKVFARKNFSVEISF